MTAFVSRGVVTGLLALCLAACASAGSSPGSDQLTLTGIVRAEPGCPGPVRLDSPCPPRPVAGATVEAERDRRSVARTTTDRNGRFTLRLPAGTYRVTATNAGGLRTTATQTVVLTANTDITLTVDSGMR
jgi:hypothetical protein